MKNREQIASYFEELQQHICADLELADGGARFNADTWKRAEGGGGCTKILENGQIIEKGGVAFSKVYGPMNKAMLDQLEMPDGSAFFATGVSIVIHPHSPMVPIIHMNVRYFELSNGQCWFGGGIDLSPHYIDLAQAYNFHSALKHICDKYHILFYAKFKNWADEYFFIKHRHESRGIGGIFFDHLQPGDFGFTKDRLFDFVKELGESFAPIYTELMFKNAAKPYGDTQKQWQNLRRGRYVEFNLLYDRGTKFGLESGGRTESILMSLPQTANWQYNFVPEPGSAEAQTLSLLQQKHNWLEYEPKTVVF